MGGAPKKTTISLFQDVTVCNRWYFLLNFQVSGKITPPNSCFVGFPINRLCIPFWLQQKTSNQEPPGRHIVAGLRYSFNWCVCMSGCSPIFAAFGSFETPKSESSSQSHPVIHVEYESVELAFNIIQCIRLCVQLVVHTIHIRLCSGALELSRLVNPNKTRPKFSVLRSFKRKQT